jgi:acyl-homoserine lactone acylase PvdQ
MPGKVIIRTKRLIACLFLSFIFFASEAQTTKTEILWDNYGVPHIYATSEKEMYYAYGWAQMQSHANLILQLYGQARGKAAAYWGKNISILTNKLSYLKFRNKLKKIMPVRKKHTKFTLMLL